MVGQVRGACYSTYLASSIVLFTKICSSDSTEQICFQPALLLRLIPLPRKRTCFTMAKRDTRSTFLAFWAETLLASSFSQGDDNFPTSSNFVEHLNVSTKFGFGPSAGRLSQEDQMAHTGARCRHGPR